MAPPWIGHFESREFDHSTEGRLAAEVPEVAVVLSSPGTGLPFPGVMALLEWVEQAVVVAESLRAT